MHRQMTSKLIYDVSGGCSIYRPMHVAVVFATGALYCFSFAIFLAHTHIQTHSIIEIPSQVMNQLHCKAERFTRIRILGNGVLGASSVRTVAQRRLHSIYDKFQQH